jgi:catechol 2,3-dioxygenase-like lactoylglutathione lyase family enzyme
MIDHVSVGVRDLARATRFYEAVLGAMGYRKHDVRPGTVGFGKTYPEFWINLRPHLAALSDTGQHVCLRARDASAVDAFHAAALAAGGMTDGAPGLRPQHGEGYYAAFVRDLDGNRIEAVTFLSGAGATEQRAER